MEKIGRVNVEFSLAKGKEKRDGELSRLATMKVEAKTKMREEAIAKVVEFGMRFQRSTLFLIR